ncbi:RHS repeat-associated core domain-containing protein [Undibacterium hunanense]
MQSDPIGLGGCGCNPVSYIDGRARYALRCI